MFGLDCPTTPRRRPRFVASLTVTLVSAIAACGGGGTSSGSSSRSATTTPAWNVIRSHVGKDGAIDRETALDAFALTIGPLPGVTPPPGTRQVFDDATGPLRWTLRHESELTAAQRQAVERYVAVVPTTASLVAPRRFATASVILVDAATIRAQIKQLAASADAAIAAKIGHPGMSWDIQLDFPSEVPKDQQDSNGYADVVDAAGQRGEGVPALCHVHITPLGAAEERPALTRTVDHEIFHCYQAAQYGSVSSFLAAPSWLIEGSAAWAAGDLSGSVPAAFWHDYLTGPETSLFQRTYDAVGFYAHMKESGEDPWGRFDSMYAAQRATGNGGALTAGLGGHAQSFLDTWATGLVRDSAVGREWDTTGPGITSDKENLATIPITAGQSGAEALPAAGNSAYVLDLEADVITLNTPPHTRAHSVMGNAFVAAAPRGTYCARNGGCVCPAGSARAGQSVPPISAGPVYLAVTGATAGAQWNAWGQTLDDFCNSDQMDTCLQGVWTEQTVSPLPDTHGLFTFPQPLGITITFAKDGSAAADFGTMPTITAHSGADAVSLKFAGKATAHIITGHGIATVTNSDISAVMFTMAVNGINIGNSSYGALFGQSLTKSSGLDFVAYTCSPHSAALTGASGLTAILAR